MAAVTICSDFGTQKKSCSEVVMKAAPHNGVSVLVTGRKRTLPPSKHERTLQGTATWAQWELGCLRFQRGPSPGPNLAGTLLMDTQPPGLWVNEHLFILNNAPPHPHVMVMFHSSPNWLRQNIWGLSWWFSGKESTCQCRRLGFEPWVREIPWRRKWQSIQYSCLGNTIGIGVWRAMVQGVTKSWTWLSD